MKIHDIVLMDKVPISSEFGIILLTLEDGREIEIQEGKPGVLSIRAPVGTLVIQPNVQNDIKVSVERT